MRALAEFTMRGRVQATLVVTGCVALPSLYWLGATAGCLVILRRGLRDNLGLPALGLLPAMAWWLKIGDPRVLLVLLGSWSLALVLRASESWVRALLFSVAAGLVYSAVLGAALRPQLETISQEIVKILPVSLGDLYQELPADEQARFASLISPALSGMIAALLQVVSVLSLVLGRYWQASLYNPGGFGREFRSIRIPKGLATLLIASMLVGPIFSPQMVLLAPICSVPLVFSGVSLIHGLAPHNRLAGFWLVGLYATLLLFIQLMYPLLVVLAIFDSMIDFRGRLASKEVDNANS
jgi:hypothetical protein